MPAPKINGVAVAARQPRSPEQFTYEQAVVVGALRSIVCRGCRARLGSIRRVRAEIREAMRMFDAVNTSALRPRAPIQTMQKRERELYARLVAGWFGCFGDSPVTCSVAIAVGAQPDGSEQAKALGAAIAEFRKSSPTAHVPRMLAKVLSRHQAGGELDAWLIQAGVRDNSKTWRVVRQTEAIGGG